MNVICMSTLGVSTGYVVHELFSAIPNVKLIALRYAARPRRRCRELNLDFLRQSWRSLEERVYYRRYQARGEQKLRQLLYGSAIPEPPPATLVLPTYSVNDQETAEQIRGLNPDVMVTVGAPLLRPHIFQIPTAGTINLHFGIAPWYRGEDTLFWPLYFGDEQRVGVTIHQIDTGIDTGSILAQGFLAVEPGDLEWELEAKAARMGARLICELLRERQLQPDWQPIKTTTGRQFNYKSRHLWHDAVVRLRRLWSPSPQPAESRVVHYGARRAATSRLGAESPVDAEASSL